MAVDPRSTSELFHPEDIRSLTTHYNKIGRHNEPILDDIRIYCTQLANALRHLVLIMESNEMARERSEDKIMVWIEKEGKGLKLAHWEDILRTFTNDPDYKFGVRIPHF